MEKQQCSECEHSFLGTPTQVCYFKVFFWRLLWSDIERMRIICPQCGFLIAPPSSVMWLSGFSLPIMILLLVYASIWIGNIDKVSQYLLFALKLIACLIALLGRSALFSWVLLSSKWRRPGFDVGMTNSTTSWYIKGAFIGFVGLVLILCCI